MSPSTVNVGPNPTILVSISLDAKKEDARKRIFSNARDKYFSFGRNTIKDQQKETDMDIGSPSNFVHLTGVKQSAQGFAIVNNTDQRDPLLVGVLKDGLKGLKDANLNVPASSTNPDRTYSDDFSPLPYSLGQSNGTDSGCQSPPKVSSGVPPPPPPPPPPMPYDSIERKPRIPDTSKKCLLKDGNNGIDKTNLRDTTNISAPVADGSLVNVLEGALSTIKNANLSYLSGDASSSDGNWSQEDC